MNFIGIKEIAAQLGWVERTVERKMALIMQKWHGRPGAHLGWNATRTVRELNSLHTSNSNSRFLASEARARRNVEIGLPIEIGPRPHIKIENQ